MAATFRPIGFAILIPTRGRAAILGKTLQRQPFLNDRDTYIGVQMDQWKQYESVMRDHPLIRWTEINNPGGSVGVAREQLRRMVTRRTGINNQAAYQYYVATDDNARFTPEACNALVQSCASWYLKTGKPTFMAGMHSTAPHFDRGAIAKTKRTHEGWTTYAGFGFIFHCIPHTWYANYSYPGGCFALEDRHMMLSAIDAGLTEFRVCMDAPFSKSRYQPGGQGDIEQRRWNCGRSIEQLAHDFPQYVGVRGTFPLPWQFIMQLRHGAKVDRLMGGAMRKGEALIQREGSARKSLKVRIRKS